MLAAAVAGTDAQPLDQGLISYHHNCTLTPLWGIISLACSQPVWHTGVCQVDGLTGCCQAAAAAADGASAWLTGAPELKSALLKQQ